MQILSTLFGSVDGLLQLLRKFTHVVVELLWIMKLDEQFASA